MERKEFTSKYEQIKSSAETVEILSKRDQASQLTVLAEARKREEKLKKAIGVKEECIASVGLLLLFYHYYYFLFLFLSNDWFFLHVRIVVLALLFPNLFVYL